MKSKIIGTLVIIAVSGSAFAMDPAGERRNLSAANERPSTPVGDPISTEAIAAILDQHRLDGDTFNLADALRPEPVVLDNAQEDLFAQAIESTLNRTLLEMIDGGLIVIYDENDNIVEDLDRIISTIRNMTFEFKRFFIVDYRSESQETPNATLLHLYILERRDLRDIIFLIRNTFTREQQEAFLNAEYEAYTPLALAYDLYNFDDGLARVNYPSINELERLGQELGIVQTRVGHAQEVLARLRETSRRLTKDNEPRRTER